MKNRYILPVMLACAASVLLAACAGAPREDGAGQPGGAAEQAYERAAQEEDKKEAREEKGQKAEQETAGADGPEEVVFHADGSGCTLRIRKPEFFDDLYCSGPDFVTGTADTEDMNIIGFYSVRHGADPDEYMEGNTDAQWMVEHENYTNVSVSGIKKIKKDGGSVRYACVSYDYRELTTYVVYSCFQKGDDLICFTMDCSVPKGAESPVKKEDIMEAWARTEIL